MQEYSALEMALTKYLPLLSKASSNATFFGGFCAEKAFKKNIKPFVKNQESCEEVSTYYEILNKGDSVLGIELESQINKSAARLIFEAAPKQFRAIITNAESQLGQGLQIQIGKKITKHEFNSDALKNIIYKTYQQLVRVSSKRPYRQQQLILDKAYEQLEPYFILNFHLVSRLYSDLKKYSFSYEDLTFLHKPLCDTVVSFLYKKCNRQQRRLLDKQDVPSEFAVFDENTVICEDSTSEEKPEVVVYGGY